jgi:hypothetical protein
MLERSDLAEISETAIAPTAGIGADTKGKRASCKSARASPGYSSNDAAIPAKSMSLTMR